METTYSDRLYEKMKAEMEHYQKWLLSQSPEEILRHAYEYTVKEDILCEVELMDDEKTAKALLRSRCPLQDVFERFRDNESSHMDEVLNCITSEAKLQIQKAKEKSQGER